MAKNITVIDSKNNISNIFNVSEIISYKDLFSEFVSRDIKMRHKQTILGVLWVIFQPLLSTVIFTIIFGLILKVPSDNLPYPVFVFVGLNFWNFFSSAITSASGSLASNESLIKKVYFPRIIIPLASIATNFFDFIISTIFLIILLFIYGILPNLWIILVFPLLTLLVLTTCIGIGLLLSSLNVRYRDIRQILPFFIQILIFLTPVFYPITMLSEQKRWILALNPLTTVIEISRSSLMGNMTVNFFNLTLSVIVSLILLVIGLLYFKKTEKYFADII